LLAQNDKAQQYYNFLLQEEIAVGSEVVKLSNLLSQGNKEELHTQLLQLKNTSAKCIEKIEEADAYPKSKYLRDACIEYLETFRHLSRNDFKELIDIITKENTDRVLAVAFANTAIDSIKPILYKWASSGFPGLYCVSTLTLNPPPICTDGITRSLVDYYTYLINMTIAEWLASMDAKISGMRFTFSHDGQTHINLHITRTP
jgi:hypothetical protein